MRKVALVLTLAYILYLLFRQEQRDEAALQQALARRETELAHESFDDEVELEDWRAS